MANNYYKGASYFQSRPDIVKIFDDLEAFHNYCRFEMVEFNEANLYNRQSEIWNRYQYSVRPKKPRGEYNRSGNNYNRNYQR